MSLTYVLSPMAEADLEDIWAYTAGEWSAEQAEVYTNSIINVFEEIAEGRKKGRSADVREGYLKALVGRHTIYFQVPGDMIAIIRILHQTMDVEQH